MPKLPKYTMDFEFTGHITVKAKTADDAVEIVDGMSLEQLKKHIQNFNVGHHYITKEEA